MLNVRRTTTSVASVATGADIKTSQEQVGVPIHYHWYIIPVINFPTIVVYNNILMLTLGKFCMGRVNAYFWPNKATVTRWDSLGFSEAATGPRFCNCVFCAQAPKLEFETHVRPRVCIGAFPVDLFELCQRKSCSLLAIQDSPRHYITSAPSPEPFWHATL